MVLLKKNAKKKKKKKPKTSHIQKIHDVQNSVTQEVKLIYSHRKLYHWLPETKWVQRGRKELLKVMETFRVLIQ